MIKHKILRLAPFQTNEYPESDVPDTKDIVTLAGTTGTLIEMSSRGSELLPWKGQLHVASINW